MIEVQNAVIERGTFALRADLTVPKGSICALIGPSGSGKSTLFEAIAGFLPLAAGRIRVDGLELGGKPPPERPVTLLFQENNLFPHLSIAANLGLGLRPSLSLDRGEKAAVERALDEVGLSGLGARRPEALSGGQRQRAALARALLRDRPALLLDEPFAALGPALRGDMLDLVRRLADERRMAILMITHAPGDARAAADIAAFCHGGRIDGTREIGAFFSDPEPALAAYLGDRDPGLTPPD